MQSKAIATAARRLGLIWLVMLTFNCSPEFVGFLKSNMSDKFGIELCCKVTTCAYACFDMPDKAIALGIADVIETEYKVSKSGAILFSSKLVFLIRQAESQKIPILA